MSSAPITTAQRINNQHDINFYQLMLQIEQILKTILIKHLRKSVSSVDKIIFLNCDDVMGCDHLIELSYYPPFLNRA